MDNQGSHEQQISNLGQLTKLEELESIVDSFPSKSRDNDERDLLRFAFGYGSGVFAQEENQERGNFIVKNEERKQQTNGAGVRGGNKKGDNENPKMIDLILVVDDPMAWHSLNMQRNAQHYSSISRMGGPSLVSWIQDFGPGLYFHPYVDISLSQESSSLATKRQIKYGIMSKEKLLKDLLNWDFLYAAGRLHKPTQTVLNVDDEIQHACDRNLTSALAASLLLLSSSNIDCGEGITSLAKVFYTIANLSYAGDVRMQLGAEDDNKVEKLVNSPGQFKRWCDLYRQPLLEFEKSGILNYNMATSGAMTSPKINYLDWDRSNISAKQQLLTFMPKRFHRLEPNLGSPALVSSLSKELTGIVTSSTRVQTLKGLISAGFSKSASYAGSKFAKGAMRRFC